MSSAGDSNISVQIKAALSGFSGVFSSAKQEVSSFVSGVKEQIGSLSAPFEALNSAMLGVAAIAAGGFGLDKIIQNSIEATEETHKLAETLGESSEQASVVHTALTLLGVSTDTYVTAAKHLDQAVRTNEAGLEQMGLTVRDSSGHLLDQQTLMQNALTLLANYKEGTDRNSAAQALFGRNTSEINELMRLNSAALQQAAQDNKDLGLGVDDKQIAETREYQTAMNELKLTMLGISNAITDALMPYLTDFAEWFRSVGPTAIAITKEAIAGVVAVFNFLEPILSAAWNGFKNLISVVVSSLDGWSAIGTAIGMVATVLRDGLIIALLVFVEGLSAAVISVKSSWDAIVQTVVSSVEYIKTEIGSWASIMADVATGQWTKAKADYEQGARDVANIMSTYTAKMGQIGSDWATAQGNSFKNTIGSMFAQGGIFGAPGAQSPHKNPYAAFTGSIPGGTQDFTGSKAGKNQVDQDALEQINAAKAVAQQQYEIALSASQQQLELGQITNEQFLEQKLALQQRLDALDEDYAQQQVDLYQQGTKEYTKALQDQLKVKEDATKKELDIENQLVKEQQKDYQQLAQSINQTLQSATASLLANVSNWKQALSNFLTGIDQAFANFAAKGLLSSIFGPGTGSNGEQGGLGGMIAGMLGGNGQSRGNSPLNPLYVTEANTAITGVTGDLQKTLDQGATSLQTGIQNGMTSTSGGGGFLSGLSSAFSSLGSWFNQMFSGIGNFFSSGSGGGLFADIGSMFGGFMAGGGPLDSGRWYIAGEHGPEPIWGGGSGAFAAGYGGSVGSGTMVTNHNYFNVQATDTNSFTSRKSETQIGAMMARVAAKGQRNM